MRQLVVAVLAYIVLQLYFPSLWSKLMSEAPSWVSASITFGIALVCIAFIGIAVSRNKDQWGRFITIATQLNPGGDFPAAFNNLSDSRKQRFIREVGIEIIRAKIPVSNIDPSKPIGIARRIPIDATLTDVA